MVHQTGVCASALFPSALGCTSPSSAVAPPPGPQSQSGRGLARCFSCTAAPAEMRRG